MNVNDVETSSQNSEFAGRSAARLYFSCCVSPVAARRPVVEETKIPLQIKF